MKMCDCDWTGGPALHQPHKRCFACGKLMTDWRLAETSDGQQIHVGVDCARKIYGMHKHGYQPHRGGGPRLFATMGPHCLPPCGCGAHDFIQKGE